MFGFGCSADYQEVLHQALIDAKSKKYGLIHESVPIEHYTPLILDSSPIDMRATMTEIARDSNQAQREVWSYPNMVKLGVDVEALKFDDSPDKIEAEPEAN